MSVPIPALDPAQLADRTELVDPPPLFANQAEPIAAGLKLAPYIALLKLRIVALLVFVSLVAAVVAGRGFVPAERMLLLVVAGVLSSAGAAALNQYFERDLDAGMVRTRRRPLPSGRVSPTAALCLGLILIVAAIAPAIALGLGTAVCVLAGAFFYVFMYTVWLKRHSCWNVPIGGIAGSCAVLAGSFAIGPQSIGATPLLMALILFFWNQSHFWAFAIARQEEYRLVGVPMLPVVVGVRAASCAILVNTLAMVFTSLAVYFVERLGAVYLAGTLVVSAIFVWQNIMLVRTPSQTIAWRNFKFSGVYLLVLFLSMAIDAVI